jgi:hypothetical protein
MTGTHECARWKTMRMRPLRGLRGLRRGHNVRLAGPQRWSRIGRRQFIVRVISIRRPRRRFVPIFPLDICPYLAKIASDPSPE